MLFIVWYSLVLIYKNFDMLLFNDKLFKIHYLNSIPSIDIFIKHIIKKIKLHGGRYSKMCCNIVINIYVYTISGAFQILKSICLIGLDILLRCAPNE